MGKRSNFERRDKDYYPTIDPRAVLHLRPHLKGIESYVEPCDGTGDLINLMDIYTMLSCVNRSDIETGTDALTIGKDYLKGADVILTNPPWLRNVLHDMIMHFKDLAPTWLLFDSEWAYTKQSIPYMKYCTNIVPVGRLTWIAGTSGGGKYNCSWYRFDKEISTNIQFHVKAF